MTSETEVLAPTSLNVNQLTVRYGGVVAVKAVSFTVPFGECVAIIGANGAGKTSLLRGVAGLTPAKAREITFFGQRIEQLSPDKRARLGLGHVLENRHVFANMTVQDNLALGQIASKTRLSRESARAAQDEVLERFPEMRDFLRRRAGLLSGGQQQMLAMARALVAKPKLLLLDEPTTGLAPRLAQRVAEIVSAVVETGTSVLLVEQSVEVVQQVAKKVDILSHGEFVTSLPATDHRLSEIAREIYLGKS